MDQSKIAEMKASIKAEYEDRIRRLRSEMESVISALSQAENTLSEWGITVKGTKGEGLSAVGVKEGGLKIIGVPNPNSAEQKVRIALTKMGGDFTTKDLKKKSEDEIGREIKKGTFAGIFSDLQKEKKVIVVKPKKGRQAGLYRRAEPHAASINPNTFVGEKGA